MITLCQLIVSQHFVDRLTLRSTSVCFTSHGLVLVLAEHNHHLPGESDYIFPPPNNILSLPYQHGQRHVSGHGYGLNPLHGRQHCPLTIIWKTQQCMTILSIYTGCKAQYFCHRQQVKSMQCSQAPREVFVSSWFCLTHYSASHL